MEIKVLPKKLGELEVGWWKLHDDLETKTDKSPLAEIFAKLYSEIFGGKRGIVIKGRNI